MHASYAPAAAKSPQSCPTLCDPIDRSPPGSPVPGILQTRTLEWGATAFSSYATTRFQILPSLYKSQVYLVQFSHSVVSDSPTPGTAARQASLSITSITNSQSLLKLMSTKSAMPSNHLILCHSLLFLPSIFPS